MKTSLSRPKKSPASKARRKSPVGPRCRAALISGSPRSGKRNKTAARQHRPATTLRRESRAWLHTELPTQLERDTLLTPEWIAESVVQEVECFLNANLPAGFAERLAARAEHIYPRHRHFKAALNRPGNRGRDNLYMFMRHWTAGWLKRERHPLHKKLPYSFGMGRPLPGGRISILPS